MRPKRLVVISLLLSIMCGIAGAAVVYSPFTKEAFTYNDDNYDITEGDIRVTKTSARNGIRNRKRLWPHGIIPYRIDYNFTSSEMRFLMGAIRSFYEKSCVRFIPAMPFQKRYVSIVRIESGCWSDVGYYDSRQNQVNFGFGCLRNEATPVHELLHTCGLEHEHNRIERDEWVKVIWDNIAEDQKHNFDKVSQKLYSDYGVPYDYNSVMHYPLDAFSMNENDTMENLKPHSGPFGYEIGWAESDIKKLQLMYHCT